jgi:hypothetical protein
MLLRWTRKNESLQNERARHDTGEEPVMLEYLKDRGDGVTNISWQVIQIASPGNAESFFMSSMEILRAFASHVYNCVSCFSGAAPLTQMYRPSLMVDSLSERNL